MRAADQWVLIEQGLAPDWTDVWLSFAPEGPPADAAAILAPLGPGRSGSELRFQVLRTASGADTLRNLLERLDRRRLWGTLSLVEATTGAHAPVDSRGRRKPLADSWNEALARLAPGWSDLLCELELDSSDHVPRAALLGAPLNPTRNREAIALRFRVSGRQGYGVAPGMARRCLERMDAEGITGRVGVLHELSDTEHEVTQGPVWRMAGRSV